MWKLVDREREKKRERDRTKKEFLPYLRFYVSLIFPRLTDFDENIIFHNEFTISRLTHTDLLGEMPYRRA